VLFDLDSIHGATYVRGWTVFGQQIALGATFDRNLTRQVGTVTARDTIAAGVPWLFAPILDLATQPAYPRVYETFGEDPFVVAELGVAMIEGIQSDSGDPELPRAAACMKHFFAYSHPANGHDRAPVYLPETSLRTYYLPPSAAAVRRADVASAMNSYNELNGVPIVASRKWLRDVLCGELGFEGMLVTVGAAARSARRSLSIGHGLPFPAASARRDSSQSRAAHSSARIPRPRAWLTPHPPRASPRALLPLIRTGARSTTCTAERSEQDAVLLAMDRTSIDMSMVPLDEARHPAHAHARARRPRADGAHRRERDARARAPVACRLAQRARPERARGAARKGGARRAAGARERARKRDAAAEYQPAQAVRRGAGRHWCEQRP
jgi:hypothetical protein